MFAILRGGHFEASLEVKKKGQSVAGMDRPREASVTQGRASVQIELRPERAYSGEVWPPIGKELWTEFVYWVYSINSR